MSKPSSQKQRTRAAEQRRVQTSDRALYIGFIVIGFAVAGFCWLVWTPYWREITLGYIAAVVWLINLYAFSVYQGKHLANWKQALARLPLRFAGYGTRDGKPVEAAHGSPKARTAIIVCAFVSAAVVVALAYFMVPDLRV